jgi:uncharacterized DUF497 family protein
MHYRNSSWQHEFVIRFPLFVCHSLGNVLFRMYSTVATNMRFAWDEMKSRLNLVKHAIHFETAALLFEDPPSVSRSDRIIDGEEHWQTLGVAAGVAVHLVAQVDYKEEGDEVIRIISARKATPRERKAHEEGI